MNENQIKTLFELLYKIIADQETAIVNQNTILKNQASIMEKLEIDGSTDGDDDDDESAEKRANKDVLKKLNNEFYKSTGFGY